MKKLFKEFREFINRGNVLDMAVGVIIATAFGKITTSLVNDVLMPFIGWLCGSADVTALNFKLRDVELMEDGISVSKEAITIGFGTFLGTIIDFLLVAFVVFIILKSFNKARALAEKATKKEEEEKKAEEEKKPTTEELLTEILAILKKDAGEEEKTEAAEATAEEAEAEEKAE